MAAQSETRSRKGREAGQKNDDGDAELEATGFTDLAGLKAHLGEASINEAMVLVDTQREKLAVSGRLFATPRGSSDALRIYSRAAAFLGSGKGSVSKVRATAGLVRIGVWVACQADRAYEESKAKKTKRRTSAATIAAKASDANAQARPLRDQFGSVVSNVAGNDHDFKPRIATAMQPAAAGQTDTSASGSLAALAQIAHELLACKSPGVVARRELYGLTAEYIKDCADEAAKAQAILKQADAPRPDGDLDSVDIDVWDGMNLAIMQKVVEAFTLARALDPTVAKLRFVSLRSLVSRRTRKPREKKVPTDSPQTSTAQSEATNATAPQKLPSEDG